MKENQHEQPVIQLQPIISYPRVASAGEHYLLTIDVQLAAGSPWPYQEEEFEISFLLETAPFFTHEPLGAYEPGIVLHRFGSTYGAAEYLLTASEQEVAVGYIKIAFLNGWGLPIAQLKLECEVKRGEHQEEGKEVPAAILHKEKEPAPVPRKNVLIASLGESPAIISIMYDLLTKIKGQPIEKVIVLHPNDKDVTRGYNRLVKKALKELDDAGQLQCERLGFDDANNYTYTYDFLSRLYKLLMNCQAKDYKVYLSLAGGHKSVAALMAWIVPLFPCVQKLYDVIGKEEEHFLSGDDMLLLMTDAQCMQAMHPDEERLAQLRLVDIPFPKGQKISPELHARLLSTSHAELEKMQDEEAEDIALLQRIAQGGQSLNVQITKQVKETFDALYEENRYIAKEVRDFLDKMATVDYLSTFPPTESFFAKSVEKYLHMVSVIDSVKCVFYTKTQNIYTDAEAKVERGVVICALEDGRGSHDRTLQEITASVGFSIVPKYTLEEIPPVLYTSPAESVLIVPLGKYPIVATQLYTLLTKQEQRTIRAVILVYPRRATEIRTSAKIIEKALYEEAKILCIHEYVSGWGDIDSEHACADYQRTLENAIEDARAQYPQCKIDLSISGGRKSMTAMTIFAAQKKGIKSVYHTLVTDDEVKERIEGETGETTIQALNRVGQEERNARLFLRAYEPEGPPYKKFVLLRVPVFSADE